MCLAAHFVGFDCGDIEDWAEGCEEHVERASEVGFLELLGQVLDVERLVRLRTLVCGRIGFCDSSGSHGCDCVWVGWLCVSRDVVVKIIVGGFALCSSELKL